jgi:hypothetical protein
MNDTGLIIAFPVILRRAGVILHSYKTTTATKILVLNIIETTKSEMSVRRRFESHGPQKNDLTKPPLKHGLSGGCLIKLRP